MNLLTRTTLALLLCQFAAFSAYAEIVRIDGADALRPLSEATARDYRKAGSLWLGDKLSNLIFNQDSKTPNTGEPGSVHVNPGSGQERKYGPDGKPEYDIDWDHDHGQGVPHGHNWDDVTRGPGVPISPWPQGRQPNTCSAN